VAGRGGNGGGGPANSGELLRAARGGEEGAKGGDGLRGAVFIGVGGRFGGGGKGFRESRDLRRCSGGGWRSRGSRLEERDDPVRIGPDLAPKKQYLPFF
jgi:hypothetical protein